MIELNAGRWSLALDETRGSGITYCRFDKKDVLRAAFNEHHDFGPLQLSSFPLLPYSNRIRGGTFQFGKRKISLPAIMPGEHNAIHGHGWVNKWTVVSSSQSTAETRYIHQADSWPWDYVATQTIDISGLHLTMRLNVENTSDEAMPCGVGFHPYFVRSPECQIRFSARQVWIGDDHGIPDKAIDIPEAFDFGRLRGIGQVPIDHCFSGWDGSASIEWPESGMRLSMKASQELDHLVAFLPQQDDFFCLEPVSNMNDAVNWLDRDVNTGLSILAPGDALSVDVRFTIESQSRSDDPSRENEFIA